LGGSKNQSGAAQHHVSVAPAADPETYLREVLSRIADHPINPIAELLPRNLVADRSAESTHAA
jgi:hypothetical protein